MKTNVMPVTSATPDYVVVNVALVKVVCKDGYESRSLLGVVNARREAIRHYQEQMYQADRS